MAYGRHKRRSGNARRCSNVPANTLDETVPDHPRLVVELSPEERSAIRKALDTLQAAGDGSVIQHILSEALLVAADQLYFWMPEWQAQERAAEEAIAQGHTRSFDTMEEMLEFLDAQ